MTTYNTGNPVPSTDVRDLYDNAENLDNLVNGPAVEYNDRLGVPRKSWAGMEQDFQDFLVSSGWEFLGDYDVDGPFTITARNQVFQRGLYLYRISGAVAIPYTTTIWAVDEPNFTPLDDFNFRQKLAEESDPAEGAALVGYRERTVHDRLDDFRTIKSFRQPGFGVPGLGVEADDEAAWDAAVAAMNAGTISGIWATGGTYLLNKTYTITRNGSAIIGDGVDNTIIKRTDGTFGDSFVFARGTPSTQQLAGVSIRDLTFYCEADMDSGGVLRFRNATRVFMSNVFVRNCFKGIWLEGIRDSRFNNIEIIQGEHYTVDRVGAYHIYVGMPTNPALKSTETSFSNLNMTTAGNIGDVNACIRIEGDVDGLWFVNSHWFGGKTGGVILSGDGVGDISNLMFTGCFFDQFTARNLIIQGTTTDANKFRLIRFVGCKFYGGTTGNVAIDSASGVKSVDFESCEFGITPAEGCQIGAGVVAFTACSFSGINQLASANGYAIQVPGSPAAGLVLTVNSCEFECSNLTYPIWLLSSTSEYHLNSCIFRNQGVGIISAEIYYAEETLIGTCGGHKVGRVAASEVATGTTLLHPNIAVDSWDITGAAGAINLIRPYWHGRRVSFKADTAIQTMTKTTGAGSIRNRADAATLAIAVSDVYLYEYRGDSFRWHQVS